MKNFHELGIDTKGQSSGQFKRLCPQCSHQRKKKYDTCLSIDLDQGVWNCHNCGWSGGLNGNGNSQWKPKKELCKAHRRYGSDGSEECCAFQGRDSKVSKI